MASGPVNCGVSLYICRSIMEKLRWPHWHWHCVVLHTSLAVITVAVSGGWLGPDSAISRLGLSSAAAEDLQPHVPTRRITPHQLITSAENVMDTSKTTPGTSAQITLTFVGCRQDIDFGKLGLLILYWTVLFHSSEDLRFMRIQGKIREVDFIPSIFLKTQFIPY